MKKRISSILDTKAKKAGLMILCAVLIGTAATGAVFASTTKPANTQSSSIPAADEASVRTVAAKWAKAIKNRDGKAQFALLSSKFQSQGYGKYSENYWVTGTSSPWVESYKISEDKNSATVMFRYATSIGFAGDYEQTLSFVQENGTCKIDSISNPKEVTAAPKNQISQYQKLQSAVDAGHQPGLMQPEEVAMEFASGTLKITNLNKMVDKIDKAVEGDRATVTFLKDGKPVLKMELTQPVKKGTGGIWAVTSWTDGKTNETHAVS